MLRGLANTLTNPRARREWRWTAFRKLGKWLVLNHRLETLQLDWHDDARFNEHPGWIPEQFPEVRNKTFAFVHVDVDLEEPTRKSIEFFYSRLNPGGILLCDDYGATFCPGATRAVDQFIASKPEKLIALSCGGAFMIKC